MIELLKNPRYQFWSKPFVRIAPELERLFEAVARSCMLPTNNSDESAAQQQQALQQQQQQQQAAQQ